MAVEQGSVVAIEGLKGNFLVVSKNFFNATEQAIVCPIVNDTHLNPLHIVINSESVNGIVMCEQVRMVDLRCRGYKRTGEISYSEMINIVDAIQGIFDYY